MLLHPREKTGKKAITLIELIVVISILSILAAAVVVSFEGVLENSEDKRNEAGLRGLQPLAAQHYRRFEVYRSLDSEIKEEADGYNQADLDSYLRRSFCDQEEVANIINHRPTVSNPPLSEIKDSIWSRKERARLPVSYLSPLVEVTDTNNAGCVAGADQFAIWVRSTENPDDVWCLDQNRFYAFKGVGDDLPFTINAKNELTDSKACRCVIKDECSS